MAEETRRITELIDQKIREELASKPSKSATFPIGGTTKQLTVIELPLNMVTLNHNNHRVSAQMEDSGILNDEDPTAESNQRIIQEKLAATEKFSALKEELLAHGQLEPGLITRDGLLVNGNTRCSALRELQKEGKGVSTISVAVLPVSVTAQEIMDIEIRLQMFRTTHQDYTFTNELKMMEKYREAGRSDKEVAKAWNWIRRGEKKVQKRMRMLNIIEEARALTDPKLPYSLFDSKETVIADLDDAYQNLANDGHINDAESLKYQRLLAMFVGLNKDQIRRIEEEFIDKIKQRLPNDSDLKKLIDDNTTQSTGNSDFEDEDHENVNVKNILTNIINNDNFIENGDIITDTADPIVDALTGEFNAETDRLVNEERRRNRNEELHTTIASIREEIKNVKVSLPDRIVEPGFKIKDFREALDQAIEEITVLKTEVNKLSPKK